MERTKFQSPGRGPYLTGRRQPGRCGQGALGTLRGRRRGGVWRRFQPQPRASGEFRRDCQHGWPQTEFWDGFPCRVGALGKATTSLPLSPPHGLFSGARGRTRAGSAGDGFAERGQLISLLLADQGAEQKRGSPLHVAPTPPPPPGPGLFRPGVTEAREWKCRRPPSAAGDGSREMRAAFKVSRNPSAAGGGWRSARGFLGLWLLRFSHLRRFLTLGFNFVVTA